MFVPVKTQEGQQLMPTTARKARLLIASGEATPYWSNGVFCMRLNRAPYARYKQDLAIGVDPGSKKEGFTAKSAAHTYLNIQADAKTGVGKKLECRRNSRRSRRYRKRPYRKNRKNRARGGVPAGTLARWHWKLRVLDWLAKLFPVTHVCVEDIRAVSRKGQRRWNASFNPLQVGKQWFYDALSARWEVLTLQGYETKALRESLGLTKTRNKTSSVFDAHCVDAWCLAFYAVGGDVPVANKAVCCITPIEHKRRCLHRERPKKGGVRARYGGTMSLGWKKQTLVKHPQHGLCLVGGHQKGRLALHDVATGKRIVLSAKPTDCKRLRRVNFRFRYLLPLGVNTFKPVNRHNL